MMQRTVTIGALLGAALVGGFFLGTNRGCDMPDGCFDQIAKGACDMLAREKRGNTAVRQRSEALPNRKKPAGVGDWVFMASCGDQLASVRFDGPTMEL